MKMDESNKDLPLKKITKNQVTGTRGEAFVSFLLSKYCLVRPVANGTDVGVDFYCEVLKDGIPHNHFWVQVKSTETKAVGTHKTLKISDLEYWSRQPIPVFIFCLCTSELQSINTFKLSVINLTEQFIKEPKIDPKGNPRKRLNVDIVLDTSTAVETFIFHTVPVAASRVRLRDGVIFPISKTVRNSYVKNYETTGIRRYSKELIKNIGRTSALLLDDICNSNDFENFSVERNQLEQILLSFEKWPNSDFHYALAFSKMKDDRDHQTALDAFRRALKIIESDSRIPVCVTANTRSLIALFIRRLESKLAQK